MIVPWLLFLISVGALVATQLMPEFSGFGLLLTPIVAASVLILLGAWWRIRSTREKKHRWIVLDGSNVMHWKDNKPKVETLREVVNFLSGKGYTPGVVFDANAGYKLSGRFLHEAALAKLLSLPEDQVMLAERGAQADPTVLSAAQYFDAPVVSNDKFQDYEAQHPEVRDPGHLIRGGYREGKLWIDLK